jgi:DNA replication protein DnaC
VFRSTEPEAIAKALAPFAATLKRGGQRGPVVVATAASGIESARRLGGVSRDPPGARGDVGAAQQDRRRRRAGSGASDADRLVPAGVCEDRWGLPAEASFDPSPQSETQVPRPRERYPPLAEELRREAHGRLRAAKLRQQASIEDVDYRAARGLDRALFQKLAEGEWIDGHDNLALVGPSGVGKSWLACAIGQKACRDNRSVLYHRWPKLCEDLALARGDGRHPRLIKSLGRADLLILDDFGLEPLDAGARHDLLEILEERYGRRSTIVTSQLPLSAWHEVIGDPTYADAILDRLVHNAHRIDLTGESLRRTRGKQSKTA